MKNGILDRTLTNLWKVWGEFSESTLGFIHGSPRPELPPEDSERLFVEVEKCILGIGDEASLRAQAAEIGQVYIELNEEGRENFLIGLAKRFGVNREKVDWSMEAVKRAGEFETDRSIAEIELRRALEPKWRSLIGRFTTLPEGVKFLVDMRAEMLSLQKRNDAVKGLSLDLRTMLSAWFDIGLLELVRIDWDSPASLLEKLIEYESVHAIKSWDDMKNRLDTDRRCYGFFHPNMPNEPLIFVQVALVDGISENVEVLLDETKPAVDPKVANTAIFYSISNAQRGLDGISFGNFLIKQVVEELIKELPNLKTFSTLSPIPGFSVWLKGQIIDDNCDLLTESDRKKLSAYIDNGNDSDANLLRGVIDRVDNSEPDDLVSEDKLKEVFTRWAAIYLFKIKGKNDRVLDPVGHFHLSNGARIERINWNADTSIRGRGQSFGLMVNYLYDLKDIQGNSSNYEANRVVAHSSGLRSILRG
jgi:malonyl-CoA decarboxylase